MTTALLVASGGICIFSLIFAVTVLLITFSSEAYVSMLSPYPVGFCGLIFTLNHLSKFMWACSALSMLFWWYLVYVVFHKYFDEFVTGMVNNWLGV